MAIGWNKKALPTADNAEEYRYFSKKENNKSVSFCVLLLYAAFYHSNYRHLLYQKETDIAPGT
ncbi:hypothetical protein DWW23_02615 [Parabacteroides sp. AF14-59]|nr:hypothetical protein DWW23_02615 [Parabacteroides sp. AF14-59]